MKYIAIHTSAANMAMNIDRFTRFISPDHEAGSVYHVYVNHENGSAAKVAAIGPGDGNPPTDMIFW